MKKRSIYDDYFDYTSEHVRDYGERTIVLMQIGAFFEVYGLKNAASKKSQLLEFARICDLRVGDKSTDYQNDRILFAGFKEPYLERYLRKLQAENFTCAVYVQDEDLNRPLLGIYSPGTFFCPETKALTNNTCCVWIEEYQSVSAKPRSLSIGVAAVDIYTGKATIFEYKESGYFHGPSAYDELERFVSVHRPSESILISNLPTDKMDDIVTFVQLGESLVHMVSTTNNNNNASTTKETKNVSRVRNCEKQIYQEELLKRFYPDTGCLLQSFYQNPFACQAFCFLLDFLYQHDPNLVTKIHEPVFENYGERLVLANHSLKQLNIIDNDGGKKHKCSSVLNLLNDCVTAMGRRKFQRDFLGPTTNVEFLQKQYDITEQLLLLPDIHEIRTQLEDIMDMEKLHRHLLLGKVPVRNIARLVQSLRVVVDLSLPDALKHYLGDLVEAQPKAKELLEFIEARIVLDLTDDTTEEGNFIHRGVDEVLDSQWKAWMDGEDKMEAIRLHLSNVIGGHETRAKEKDTKDYVKLHETEKNHYSLLATNIRCKVLEDYLKKCSSNSNSNSNSKRIDYLSSHDGSIRHFDFFIDALECTKHTATTKTISSSQIRQLCRDLSNAKAQMKEQMQRVYRAFLQDLCARFSDTVSEFVSTIDVAFTRTLLARKYGYCKPTLVCSDASVVHAQGLRHCLIERLQDRSELYVANDLELSADKRGILLYGTNAVGKTSLIRALGIAVIMAQAGLYVPANAFAFRPYRALFTRILGNDDLHRGLSTFVVEMTELRTILRLSDENSLVLGDELCSGTETVSAISIFVAGIQSLYKSRCTFLFATHLHEIVQYDEIRALRDAVALKHMTVTYDKERDILVYDRKLRDGSGPDMYGLEVCKALRLPADFLENAHQVRLAHHATIHRSVLDLTTSQYNARHLTKTPCSRCGERVAEEVHHLQPQEDANDDGLIVVKGGAVFHKNHRANLTNLCAKCHDDVHRKPRLMASALP